MSLALFQKEGVELGVELGDLSPTVASDCVGDRPALAPPLARRREGALPKCWCQVQVSIRFEIPEIQESVCDFVPQDVGGELIMPRKCPEMRRKDEG